MTLSKVIWCDRGWMPYWYGFCPDEAAWKRECKRLGIVGTPYPTADAHCLHLENAKDVNKCTLVTVSHEKKPAIVVLGVIVHEAMHVWRQMRLDIGEREPSSEFEAYSMQFISMQLIYAYEKTRGKLCRG